jgi:hypothetical protein
LITAAFQQRPFTTAAVCEAAVRGAARHNLIKAGGVSKFASLSTKAFCEAAAAPGCSSSSSGSCDIIAAAASDSSARDALLLHFALITTHSSRVPPAAFAASASFYACSIRSCQVAERL